MEDFVECALCLLTPVPGVFERDAGQSFPLGSYTKPWVDVRGYGRIHQVRFEQNGLGADFEIDAYGLGVIGGIR